MGQHVDLVDYDDNISKAISPALAVAVCALECARWKREVTQKDILPRLEQQYELMRVRYPVSKFLKTAGGMPHWTNKRAYIGVQGLE